MADTARITQSVIETLALGNGVARITQGVVEVLVGVGVDCNNPPPVAIYAAYSHALASGGGLAPYTYLVTGGALPTGLTLGASTGVITGNPVVSGTFDFTVTVVDAQNMSASAACELTVTGTAANVAATGGLPGPLQPFSKGGCLYYNEYDRCLLEVMQRWRHIQFPDLCVIPKEYRNSLPWTANGESGAIPPQAIPFRKAAGITTPDAVSGDQVVVSWIVPLGYDGLLTGFYFGYSGSGFVQGSGDIVTRLRLNQRYLKDLGNSPYILGSPQLPIPMTEGQILLSGTRVQSIVSVPNLSGNIVVGASTIFAGQIGFLWPRG